MSRATLDAIVVGGGIVGSALALGLRQRGADVALVDSAPAPVWRPDSPDLRVYAIAADSQQLLDRLGVWVGMRQRRVSPYSGMRVWDAGGGGELHIDAASLGVPQLGHIVEHSLIADRLHAALLEAGVRVEAAALDGIENERCENDRDATERDGSSDATGTATRGGVSAQLADGRRLRARWLFGADGARSAVREALGIAVEARDYAASGLVAYLRIGKPHEATCWQRFLPTGPLALLPCADGRVSIVWSLPQPEAERLADVPADQFDAEITRASDRVLGALSLDGERRLFPLKRVLAKRMHAGRCALLGDAAHVVHPLAGQGVNLGLRDIAALLDAVDASRVRGEWLTPARLERWARARHSENALAAHAFDAIHRAYSNDAMLPVALRGLALGAANLPPIRRMLWRAAAGLA